MEFNTRLFDSISLHPRHPPLIRCLLVLCAMPATLLVHAQSTDSLPVVVATVVEAKVNSGYRVVGDVNPLRTSTIGSAVDGRVEEFLVDVGNSVRAGQPLARIRTETLRIELAAASAELELYRHQLAEQRNGARPEEVAEAQARADGAQAAQNNASGQLDRLRSLSATGAATDADLENARERLDLAIAASAAAAAVLERVEQGPRLEQIAQAEARVELQKQRVRLIEDRIAKHTIQAPFAGYVSEEHTEVGAWIGAGDPIAQIIQLDKIEIHAPVTADHATKLRLGTTVRVEFPELPDKLLTGTIDRIVPVATSRARTFPVFIRLENELRDGGPLLMSGMLARVELPAGRVVSLPMVPKDALVLNDRDRAVFVVDLDSDPSTPPQGRVRKVPVDLGVAMGSLIQVRGDLAAGQVVVVVGNERLVPGAHVTVIEPEPSHPPAG